jgi:hypothetical protein
VLVLVVAREVDVQQARVLEVGWKGDREQALLLPGVRHLIGDVEGWFVERPAVPDDPDPSRPLDDVEVGAAGRLRDVVRLVELADLVQRHPSPGGLLRLSRRLLRLGALRLRGRAAAVTASGERQRGQHEH